MASLHAGLPNFDARNTWESYSRELEQYFEINNVLNDNEKVAVLLTVLRDSCHPELPRLKTYAGLSELMKTHHSPQPSVFKQRVKFYGATQAQTESRLFTDSHTSAYMQGDEDNSNLLLKMPNNLSGQIRN